MTEIDYLAQLSYSAGRDPLDVAIERIRMIIETRDEIRDARATQPHAFPCYGRDITPEHFARRALAWLLDAGWSPPDLSEVSSVTGGSVES